MISENTSVIDQPANDVSDRYRESNRMIEELRAHADVCGGSLPLAGGCGLTVADILRRKAARRAAAQKPVTFYSIETVEEVN